MNPGQPKSIEIAPQYFATQEQAARMFRANDVLVDDSRLYRKQTAANRCRIRTPDGLLWLTIPLTRSGKRRSIRDVQIDNSAPWARKHWRSLEFNYRSTPYFEYFEHYIAPLYDRRYTFLGEFTLASTYALLQGLGLENRLRTIVDSRSSGDVTNAGAEQQNGVERHGSGARLVTPLADRYQETEYRQNFEGFYFGTSVVDMLFNLGPECMSRLISALVPGRPGGGGHKIGDGEY